MAIYHLSAQNISRGNGKSATTAAAYRSASKIYDEAANKTYDYSRKQGVFATKILTPPNAPNWATDRQQLWNKVELTENRKDSRVAKEFNIALPVELSHQAKRDLVEQWANEQFVSLGLIADIAYHSFDTHNPHAHVMLTTRIVDENGFGCKLRECDKKDFLFGARSTWADYANDALAKAGSSERIDHRSLEAQGIGLDEQIPQIHLGAKATAMARNGISSERHDRYKEIEAANQILKFNKKRKETQDQQTVEPIPVEVTPAPGANPPQATVTTPKENPVTVTRKEEDTSEVLIPTQGATSNTLQPPEPEPLILNNQLTDTELLARMKRLNDLAQRMPSPPNLKKRKQLEANIKAKEDDLIKLEISIAEKERLLNLPRPRALLHALINLDDFAQKKIELINETIEYDKLYLEQSALISELEKLQTYQDEYQKWLFSPQAARIDHLQQELKSPNLKARIINLKEISQAYTTALTFLQKVGIKKDGKTSHIGTTYTLKKIDNTLYVNHKDKPNPILIVTGKDGKITNVDSYGFDDSDKQLFQAVAKEMAKELTTKTTSKTPKPKTINKKQLEY